MSVSLPDLDIRLVDVEEIRRSWESDFAKNFNSFSDGVATGIAKYIIEELGKTLNDPYKKEISFENKLEFGISLDITKNNNAKTISKLAASSKELPPFKEWLTKFSLEEADSRRNNRKYFIKFMETVGELAEKSLKQKLCEFKDRSCLKEQLHFDVRWCPEQKVVDDDTRYPWKSSHRLHIALWLDNGATPLTSVFSFFKLS